MCTTKWSYGTVKGGETRVMLDMIWHINQQTIHLHGGQVVVHNDNIKLINNQLTLYYILLIYYSKIS